jgi:hypothetical protein
MINDLPLVNDYIFILNSIEYKRDGNILIDLELELCQVTKVNNSYLYIKKQNVPLLFEHLQKIGKNKYFYMFPGASYGWINIKCLTKNENNIFKRAINNAKKNYKKNK